MLFVCALLCMQGGPRRVLYKFDSGRIEVGPLSLSFTPPGGGWSDSTFCDDNFRVVRNSRGDTLVFTRASANED